jgi:hypothetical protein
MLRTSSPGAVLALALIALAAGRAAGAEEPDATPVADVAAPTEDAVVPPTGPIVDAPSNAEVIAGDDDTEAMPLAVALPAARDASRAYAIADVLFLGRDNQSTSQVIAAAGRATLIETGLWQFPVQPGLRLFVGAADQEGAGWEVGYLGVWNMFTEHRIAGQGDVQAADPLALLVSDFNGRDAARATYASTLNSAEANLFARIDDGGFSRRAPQPWRRCAGYCRGTVDWLAGFRWAGLEEASGLTLDGGGIPVTGSYAVRSSTQLFGAQLGGRGRMEWERWAFEGWAKAALCGAALNQSQSPVVDAVVPDPPIRAAQSAAEGGVGFIGDINATLVYRLTETWGLRAGYNLIWLSGVALAPNQFDFGAETTSGSDLHGGAGLFLHGASLGLEARW